MEIWRIVEIVSTFLGARVFCKINLILTELLVLVTWATPFSSHLPEILGQKPARNDLKLKNKTARRERPQWAKQQGEEGHVSIGKLF